MKIKCFASVFCLVFLSKGLAGSHRILITLPEGRLFSDLVKLRIRATCDGRTNFHDDHRNSDSSGELRGLSQVSIDVNRCKIHSPKKYELKLSTNGKDFYSCGTKTLKTHVSYYDPDNGQSIRTTIYPKEAHITSLDLNNDRCFWKIIY